MRSLLRKLRPVKLDQLIYIVTPDDDFPEPRIRFDAEAADIRLVQETKDRISYRLSIKGKQVHKSNVFYATHFLKTINKYGYPVIGDCHTDNACRGQGIYPYMLSYIYKELLKAYKEVYVLVSPENTPSIKGIEKAGFKKVARIKTTRVGPFYFNKQKLR